MSWQIESTRLEPALTKSCRQHGASSLPARWRTLSAVRRYDEKFDSQQQASQFACRNVDGRNLYSEMKMQNQVIAGLVEMNRLEVWK